MTVTDNDFAEGAPADSLDLVMDLEFPVIVRFGRRRMRLGELAELSPGSVVEFDRASEDQVEVVVNGRVIAVGEAVVVEGNYGVRITGVLSRPGRGVPPQES